MYKNVVSSSLLAVHRNRRVGARIESDRFWLRDIKPVGFDDVVDPVQCFVCFDDVASLSSLFERRKARISEFLFI